MAVEVWEAWSREVTLGKESGIEVLYIVNGTTSEEAALFVVTNFCPVVWRFAFWRQAIKLTPTGPDVWEAKITFGGQQQPNDKGQTSTDPNDGTWKLSFDSTGGTQHVNQSIWTVTQSCDPAYFTQAPNFNGAVNVSESGVGGTDIHVPVFAWHETRPVTRTVVTLDYINSLVTLVAKTNKASFRGFAEEQVLFLGARGDISGRDPGYYEIVYNFAASPNRQNVTIGKCPPVNKKGWQYIWALYAQSMDPTAKYKIMTPAAVYVEQMYTPDDFSKLLIGS